MREIKFRAYLFGSKRMSFQNEWFGLMPNYNIQFADQGYYVNSDDKKEFELMQFTGLLDKNGKEIYEWDIIKAHSEIGKVEYNSALGLFELVVKIDSEEGTMTIYSKQVDDRNVYREVIGNVFENPELLK